MSQQPPFSRLQLENQSLTEQLQAAQEKIDELSYILDALPGSIYWKDQNGTYLGQNRFARNTMEKYGFDNQSVVGKKDDDLFSPAIAKRFRANDLLVMQKDELTLTEERALLADGREIYQLSYKQPLKDKQGNVCGIIGNTVDITEQKRIEAELRDAKEEAERANSFKQQFILNMEHDLRTPCAGIAEMAKICAQQAESSKLKNNLNMMADSAGQLLHLLNDVMLFSREHLGTPKISSHCFNLKSLIEGILQLESMAIGHKNLSVNLDYNPEINEWIIADKRRIHRILLNLIGNAIKFTSKGFVNIQVDLYRRINVDKAIISIKVIDSGIGIPQEFQQMIYEQFTRLSPSNAGEYKGSGLGLAIVKRLVDEISGEISLSSQINKGTVFSLLVPVALSESPKIALAQTQISNHHLLASENEAVLIVEDDPLAIEIASVYLIELGWKNIDIATNGVEAIQHLKETKYGVIFLDLGLPDMKGIDIVKKIQEGELPNNQLTPVVVLSAHTSDTAKGLCDDIMVSAILEKPLSLNNLQSIMLTICNDKQ